MNKYYDIAMNFGKLFIWSTFLAAEAILFAVLGHPVHQRRGNGVSHN